jgi:RNA polymerase sigma-70 factor (ECF subfamily)
MDEDDFTRVYRAHVKLVWRLTRALGVDVAHVDDVVHDIFLVVRKRLPTRDTQWPLPAWLGRITRNTVLHHMRTHARIERRTAMVSAPDPVRLPDEELALTEAARLMQTFLDTLDPDRREVFVLMEIEGMSAPEVADICGAKLPTVYTRLRAARIAFAKFGDALRDHTAEGSA